MGWRWRWGGSFFPLFVQGNFHGSEKQTEEGVASESLRLLMTAPLDDSGLRKTQRALCLMFLFCGMAFVDFAHLKKSDIRNGVLRYNRQKTGTPMLVEIQPVAKELLAALMTDTLRDSPYLFTFLSGTKTGEEAFREYTSAFQQFLEGTGKCLWCDGNGYLVLNPSLFRTTLKEQGVPIEMISELLGHQSIRRRKSI